MRHKLMKSDGVTEITKIKSFHFHDQRSPSGTVKTGNAISGYIEAEYYLDGNSAVQEGEELLYYQVVDVNSSFVYTGTDTDILMGHFTVKTSTVKKHTCVIVAYDDIVKLDVNYSERMKAIKSSFPMSVSSLISDAASFAGVTVEDYSTYEFAQTLDAQINYFSSDTITARDIFSWAAELVGRDLAVDPSSNEIKFAIYDPGTVKQFWQLPGYYIICPSDTPTYYSTEFQRNLINVFYKQDGLSVKNYTANQFDSAAVCRSNGDVKGIITPYGTQNRTLKIIGNTFIDYMVSSDLEQYWGDFAAYNLSHINDLIEHAPFSVKLFPFRCPFWSGDCVSFLESDGTTISVVPIMSVDWLDDAVTVELYGEELSDYDAEQTTTVVESNASQSIRIEELYDDVSWKIRRYRLAVPATTGTIFRIPTSGTNSGITTDTVVLECEMDNPEYIPNNINWQSYNGYIEFTGKCTSATNVNVVIGTKGN